MQHLGDSDPSHAWHIDQMRASPILGGPVERVSMLLAERAVLEP